MADQHPDNPPGVYSFARKLGTITAAAAALLASNAAYAKPQDPLSGFLGNLSILTISELEDRSTKVPPLVLKPSVEVIQLAGHRSHSSHSSHSSHRSHVSGSGHASHYSSSVGARTSVAPSSVKSSAVPSRSGTIAPSLPERPVPQINPEKQEDRFQLVNLPNVKEEVRAYIKDRTTGKSVLLSIGEEIAGFVLVEIDSQANTVRLRAEGKPDVTLRKLGVTK